MVTFSKPHLADFEHFSFTVMLWHRSEKNYCIFCLTAATVQTLKGLSCHGFLLNGCKNSNNDSIKENVNNQPFCLRLLDLYNFNEAEIALREHSPVVNYASIEGNAS